jgi:hypothetical protein
MRAHLGGDIVDAESSGGRVGEHAGDERTQLTAVIVWRLSLLRRRGDEGPDAAPRVDDAGALELGVDASDSVGVDAEIDGELADGRELIAGLEAAGGDRGAEAAVELCVDWGAIPRVDGNQGAGDHVTYCTSSLEQVNQEKSLGAEPRLFQTGRAAYFDTIFRLSAEIIILPPP